MKKVLLTGTTGMVGHQVLMQCIKNDEIAQITSITRRATGVKHPKLKEVIHDDFMDYSAVAGHLEGLDLVFHCLGIYTKQAEKEVFRKITVDFTEALGLALKTHSPKVVFCLFSAQGADSTEKSTVNFAKFKGTAENRILSLNFPNTHIFRPGYIYPTIPREKNVYGWVDVLIQKFYHPVLTHIFPHFGITSEQLATVMVEVGLKEKAPSIFSNKDMRLYLNSKTQETPQQN